MEQKFNHQKNQKQKKQSSFNNNNGDDDQEEEEDDDDDDNKKNILELFTDSLSDITESDDDDDDENENGEDLDDLDDDDDYFDNETSDDNNKEILDLNGFAIPIPIQRNSKKSTTIPDPSSSSSSSSTSEINIKSGIKIHPNTNSIGDVLELFIGDDFLQHLTDQSNIYRYQNPEQFQWSKKKQNKNKKIIELEMHSNNNLINDIKPNEMKTFLAILIMMGQIRKDNLIDYWTTDPLFETPTFGKLMARERFLYIWKCWHFNDNKNDDYQQSASSAKSTGTKTSSLVNLHNRRLIKVKPIINYIQKTFIHVYRPKSILIVREGIIPWKGPLRLLKYNGKTMDNANANNKKDNNGLLIRMICDQQTGYICNFDIIDQNNNDEDDDEDDPDDDDEEHENRVIKKKENTKFHCELLKLLNPYLNGGFKLYQNLYEFNATTANLLLKYNTRICGPLGQKWLRSGEGEGRRQNQNGNHMNSGNTESNTLNDDGDHQDEDEDDADSNDMNLVIIKLSTSNPTNAHQFISTIHKNIIQNNNNNNNNNGIGAALPMNRINNDNKDRRRRVECNQQQQQQQHELNCINDFYKHSKSMDISKYFFDRHLNYCGGRAAVDGCKTKWSKRLVLLMINFALFNTYRLYLKLHHFTNYKFTYDIFLKEVARIWSTTDGATSSINQKTTQPVTVNQMTTNNQMNKNQMTTETKTFIDPHLQKHRQHNNNNNIENQHSTIIPHSIKSIKRRRKSSPISPVDAVVVGGDDDNHPSAAVNQLDNNPIIVRKNQEPRIKVKPIEMLQSKGQSSTSVPSSIIAPTVPLSLPPSSSTSSSSSVSANEILLKNCFDINKILYNNYDALNDIIGVNLTINNNNRFPSQISTQPETMNTTAAAVATSTTSTTITKKHIKTPPNKRRRGVPRQDNPKRLSGDMKIHFLTKIVTNGIKKNPQRACRVCSAHKIRRDTSYMCHFCLIPLHKGDCFQNYHTLENY